jgi:hypothetical protein
MAAQAERRGATSALIIARCLSCYTIAAQGAKAIIETHELPLCSPIFPHHDGDMKTLENLPLVSFAPSNNNTS